MSREKIIIAAACFKGEKRACMLFPDNNSPQMAYSPVGLANQQAENLGRKWKDITTYDVPKNVEYIDPENDDLRFTLEALTPASIRTFEAAMVEIFDSI